MEEKVSGENVSTQKSLPPTFDPGWNDTPKWASPHSANLSSTPTKRLLNKRVPFPMNSPKSATSSPANQSQTSGMSRPPPIGNNLDLGTAPHAPMAAPTDTNAQVTCITTNVDKQQMLKDTLENLQYVIEEHVQKKKVEEVQKRLDLMKLLWLEDKLNDFIYQNMLEISKALREGDVDKADKLHITLMINHTSLCSAWIPSIRHIISELKEKDKITN